MDPTARFPSRRLRGGLTRATRAGLVLLSVTSAVAVARAQAIAPAATIMTDKPDHAPGEVVTITGRGWGPREMVTIVLHETAELHPDRVVQAGADANGTFVNTAFSPEAHATAVTFTVTATGSISGAIAQTQFRDQGPAIPTGRPDTVPMVGPVSEDRDVRSLPYRAPKPSTHPVLKPHPSSQSQGRADRAEDGGDFWTLTDLPAPLATPSPLLSFDAISAATSECNCLPPDTNGDVGPNHYIQSVNSAIEIYNKAGATLAGPTTYNSFFAALGAGNPCGADQNDGDGIVFYDHLADRWVVSDFAFPAFPGTSFWQCIGVSKGGDPVSGGWWLYALRTDPSNTSYLGDYPKFGLWPDAYYLTVNLFSGNTTFNGVRVYALDRNSMINGAGAPTPNAVAFNISPATLGDAASLLPATFRFGAPPAGRNEYLLAINSSATGGTVENEVFAWRFHVDFATPANSVLGVGASHAPNGTISVNNFVEALQGSTSFLVPQSGTTRLLDTLGDRLMYPLYYQDLGGTESLYAAHTVNNNQGGTGPAGIRWYQFNVTGGTVPGVAAQQQTFTNGGDGLWRWMPSLAADSSGNLAVGYSVSSGVMNPAIRYAARLATDPPNTLAQGEAVLINGTGSQTFSIPRWGDYSAMSVDVADGCTFWHTNEYYAATSSANWNTRVGAFKFSLPKCGGSPAANYTLTILKSGYKLQGKVTSTDGLINCGSACSATYAGGTVVQVQTIVNSGYTLTWSGAGCGSTVTMDQNRTCTADIEPAGSPPPPPPPGSNFTLTILKSGYKRQGMVTSADGLINCGGTCAATYGGGTVVSLTITTNAGYFGTWSGAGCGSAVTMDQNRTCTADIEPGSAPPPSGPFTLTIVKTGAPAQGTVTSGDGQINCGSTCAASYASGTTVQLTASAASGYFFNGWSGAGCGSSVVMTQDRTCSADFEATPPPASSYTLTIVKAGYKLQARISSVGGAITCGQTCSATFAAGTTVTLTVTFNTGFSQVNWSPEGCGTTVVMNQNRTCTADIEP